MPPLFILKGRHPDIENWENQILPAERSLALEEGIELEFTMDAADGARRHNRNEEDRFGNRSLYFIRPQRAVRDCRRVLPQAESAAELQAQFAVDAGPQPRQRPLRMLVIASRVAEEADEFGKVSQ